MNFNLDWDCSVIDSKVWFQEEKRKKANYSHEHLNVQTEGFSSEEAAHHPHAAVVHAYVWPQGDFLAGKRLF